ncbi:response regulator [Dulcicalothrix desertica]|nr:response regulator [Dulcicalothrix desertica]
MITQDKNYMDVFASSSKASNKHILIVDDNPDNIILLEYMLEETGCQISTAYSGNEALAIIESHPPDLIFLDLMMPGMSGIEVACCIRRNPYTQSIPIVLVTAYMDDVDLEDYKLFNERLAKPINENKLLLLLDLFISNRDN